MTVSWEEIPPIWRGLVAALNQTARVPDGIAGIRDVDAPCEMFEPGEPASAKSDCSTDGHYICAECIHIDLGALRRRRDQCADCGARLDANEDCTAMCSSPVVAEAAQAMTETRRAQMAVELYAARRALNDHHLVHVGGVEFRVVEERAAHGRFGPVSFAQMALFIAGARVAEASFRKPLRVSGPWEKRPSHPFDTPEGPCREAMARAWIAACGSPAPA